METLSRIGIEASGGETFQALAGQMDRAVQSADRLEQGLVRLTSALNGIAGGAAGLQATVAKMLGLTDAANAAGLAMATAAQAADAIGKALAQGEAKGAASIAHIIDAANAAGLALATAAQGADAIGKAMAQGEGKGAGSILRIIDAANAAGRALAVAGQGADAIGKALVQAEAKGAASILRLIEGANTVGNALAVAAQAGDAVGRAMQRGSQLAVQAVQPLTERVQALAQAWQQVELATRDAATAAHESGRTVAAPAPAPAPPPASTPSPAAGGSGGGSTVTVDERIEVALERAETARQAFERGLQALGAPLTTLNDGLRESAASFRLYESLVEGSAGKSAQLAIALTQLSRNLGETKAGVADEARTMAQARGEFDSIQAAVARLDAQQARYEARIGTMRTTEAARAAALAQSRTAFDGARDSIMRADDAQLAMIRVNGQLAASLQTITAEAKTAGAAVAGLGSGGGMTAGQRNFAIINATENARQFIEQISFGTSPFQALTQQLPQATVGFGLLGAGIGIAVAALSGGYLLLRSWSGGLEVATKNADQAREATDKLTQGLHLQSGSAVELVGSFAGLNQAQQQIVSSAFAEKLRTQAKEVEQLGKTLETTMRDVRNAASTSPATRPTDLGAIANPEAAAEATAAITRLDEAWAAYQEASSKPQTAATANFDAVKEAVMAAYLEMGKGKVEAERLTGSFVEQAGTMLIGTQKMAEYRNEVLLLLAAMGDTTNLDKFDRAIAHSADVQATAMTLIADARKRDIQRRFQDLKDAGPLVAAAGQAAGVPTEAVSAAQTHAGLELGDEGQQRRTQDALDRMRIALGLTNEQAQQYLAATKNLDAGLTDVAKQQQVIARLETDITFGVGDQAENTKVLTAEREKLVRLESDHEAALRSQLGSMAAAVSATEKRRVEQEKLNAELAKASREGTPLPLQDAAAARQGIDQRYAQALEQDAANQNKAADQRVVVQAQINALTRAEKEDSGFAVVADREKLRLRTELANIEQKVLETVNSQLQSMTASLGPEQKLTAEMEKIDALRTKAGKGGDTGLFSQAEQGAFARYAQAVEQNAANQNKATSQRVVVQAQINALVQAEGQHRQGTAVFEAEITRLKTEQVNLDERDAEKIAEQNRQVDAQLEKVETRNAQLRRRSGDASLGEVIADARKAAQDAIKPPTPEQMDAPGGAAQFDVFARQRERAGSGAEDNAVLTERMRILQQIRTPFEKYTQDVVRANELLALGAITQEQYNREVGDFSLVGDQFAETMKAISAQERDVNADWQRGNITLARRNALLAQEVAARGNAASKRRQGEIAEAQGIGTAGSGADFNTMMTAGLRSGADQIVETYGNVSTSIAQLMTGAFEKTTDALSQFILTGKADFRGMAQGILQDIVQITIKLLIARAIMAAFGMGGTTAGPTALIPGLGGGGGGGGGMAGGLTGGGMDLGSGLYHRGGIVGDPGVERRFVPPTLFDHAPRFHGGGIVGLMPGEVPIIAQRGERVTPANDVGQGMQNVTVHQTISIDARGSSDPAGMQRAGRAFQAQAQQQMVDSLSRSPRGRQRIAAR